MGLVDCDSLYNDLYDEVHSNYTTTTGTSTGSYTINNGGWLPYTTYTSTPLEGGTVNNGKTLDEVISETIDKKMKEENSMINGNNFLNGMFGPVKGGLCRLTIDGDIAVKAGGGYKTYNVANRSFVNCDNFVFDIGDEMFFVIPTNEVKPGDIILAGNGEENASPRYVLKVEEDMLTVVNYKNGTVENILPERHVFMGNTYFYGKIVSMFGNLAGKNGGGNAENVMKYMMMSQMFKQNGANNGMNPMMMMMFMNGGGFGNMFDGLFGGKKEEKKEAEAEAEVKE